MALPVRRGLNNSPAPSFLASQVEAQFGQLRCLIQTSLQQTSEAALWRQQQAAAAAPPPLNTNARMRSSEEVAPADADVAVQHHSMSPAGARKTAAVRPPGSSKGRGVKHQRGAEPRCSGESLHSL